MLLKLCMLAMVVVAAAILIRQWKSDFSILLRLSAVVLFGLAAISAATPLIEYLTRLASVSGLAPYAETLLKALGIAFLTQYVADICRESGESAAASGVETVGKLEILLLSLPLIDEILRVAERLLSMGGER